MNNTVFTDDLVESLLAQVTLSEPEHILEVTITTIFAD